MIVSYVCDVKQATKIKVLQHVMGSRNEAPLITQGNGTLGEDPPKSIPTWSLK